MTTMTKRTGVPYYYCEECARLYRRRKNLLKRYNLTLEQYENIRKSQLGKCAICEIDISENTIYIDHCHETGNVRGMLCMKCNSGIGYLKDDYRILERATEYLKNGQENIRNVHENAQAEGL